MRDLPMTSETFSPPFSTLKRAGSSPPSPVFDLPPRRFMAIARVLCASVEIDPSDIAPVAKRLTISLAGSTSSSGSAGTGGLELEQSAQRHVAPRLVVDQLAYSL
jgi:hypothetical protein